MKISKNIIMETIEIIKQINKNGFAVKQFHSIEKGVPQQYKVKIYTRYRIIDNIYVN